MIGLGLGLGLSRASGVTYSAEATALFAAMSVQPTTTRKGQIDALIVGLKSDGVWTKLDWLTVLAAHDAQAGRVNWVTPAQVASEVNAPTFEVDRGYTGNGTTSYLASGWTSAVVGAKMVLNNSSLFAWSRTDVNNTNQYDLGNARNQLNSRSLAAGGPVCRVNDGTGTGQTLASSIGLTVATRTDSANRSLYRNASLLGTNAQASVALGTSEMFILAQNNSVSPATVPANYSTRQIAVAGWGSHLTADNVTALHTRLNTFLTAIGAA